MKLDILQSAIVNLLETDLRPSSLIEIRKSTLKHIA